MVERDDGAADRLRPWWGTWDVPTGGAVHFVIGPLTLWVQRLHAEWQVVHWASDVDHLSEANEIEEGRGIEEPPAGATVVRFATERHEHELRLSPMLADRSVVTRPETPIYILGGDEVGLYVGSPLWVRLAVGLNERVLTELPAVRPSDTWFGPSTREGELGYAARTSARLDLEHLRPKPTRAVTKVVVRNVGDDNLRIERLNLPVPQLSLFVNRQGLIWTNTITVERDRLGALAKVTTSHRPPEEAGSLKELTGARVHDDRNVMIRALSALLS